MVNTSSPPRNLTVRIPAYEGGGKRRQYRTIWSRYNQKGSYEKEGEWYCVTCGNRIACKARATQDGYAHRQLHHLVKQRHFPNSFQVDRDCIPDIRARQSRNHPSNVVPVCRSCHLGLWEGWENGRPHIMTWLFKDITGEETDLALWPEHTLRDDQRTLWSSAESVATRRQDGRCIACNHIQKRNVTRRLYHKGELTLSYTGRDVRAVHVIPPTVAPQLAHVPRNLVLLCWNCLFGEDSIAYQVDVKGQVGWRNESLFDWIIELAPHLDTEYREIVT